MGRIAYCEYDTYEIKSMLREKGYDVRLFSEGLSSEEYINVEIVLGNPPKKELKEFSNLRFMQLRSAGANGYDDIQLYQAVQAKNRLQVATAQGVYNQPIAEYVIGMMCLLGKRSISAYIMPRWKWKIPGGGVSFKSMINMILN